jgi:hypothetical protein
VFAHLPDARGKLCGQHMRHISHGKYGCQCLSTQNATNLVCRAEHK